MDTIRDFIVDYISKHTYEDYFYKVCKGSKSHVANHIYGFPIVKGPGCNSKLKMSVLNKFDKSDIIQYIGIAADEPNRFHTLSERKQSPLIMAGWDEIKCREWCE